MKRKALVIGNTSGLAGVKNDIVRFTKFLESARGGSWYGSEIKILQNPRKREVLAQVETMKADRLDYAVVMFSGHGGHIRTTQLELNDDETLDETSLQKIATRQLNIYDCCRVSLSLMTKSLAMESANVVYDSALAVRKIYEERILQAIPQQVSLYACSVGEVSYDTSDGAVYLSELLAAANRANGARFLTVGAAHEAAAQRVEANRRNHPNRESQVPQAVLPKCLSAQQLILAMNA